jgi:hypothetical protein
MIRKSSRTDPLLSDSPDIDSAPAQSRVLPHERDEKSGAGSTQAAGSAAARRKVVQAGEDVERGLVDTERRGVPSNVPRNSP